MVKFIFDLDGTLTKKETLPIISDYFSLQEKIAELTTQTVQGNIPFVESFIRRVSILGKCPVSEVSELLAKVELHLSFQPIRNIALLQQETCCVGLIRQFGKSAARLIARKHRLKMIL